ncbi:UNKNOWN [Stylonychia lemnae]|uniref:Uncharacterized protein n=1 Tax=Stylonychia lemnae TaxID=5949 RepID=A0A078B9P3_STYLE|nr:UNKNOWN [Stylonychia lemnae]|eukprot:CDW89967.1 UNKNOWN [Stylonychia lemnae]
MENSGYCIGRKASYKIQSSSSSKDQAFIIFEKMGPSLDQQIDKSTCQKLSTTAVMNIGIQLHLQEKMISYQLFTCQFIQKNNHFHG